MQRVQLCVKWHTLSLSVSFLRKHPLLMTCGRWLPSISQREEQWDKLQTAVMNERSFFAGSKNTQTDTEDVRYLCKKRRGINTESSSTSLENHSLESEIVSNSLFIKQKLHNNQYNNPVTTLSGFSFSIFRNRNVHYILESSSALQMITTTNSEKRTTDFCSG